MKTKEAVKKCLQTAAASEAHAVVQYKGDAACLAAWGIPRLAKKFKGEAKDEAHHLQKFLDRIAFVESYPEFEVEAPEERKGVQDLILGALALEQEAVSQYQSCAAISRNAGDEGTACLFLHVLKDEEDHLMWLEGQKYLLDKLGEKDYTTLWAVT